MPDHNWLALVIKKMTHTDFEQAENDTKKQGFLLRLHIVSKTKAPKAQKRITE